MYKIIAIIGKSGAGKDFFLHKFLKKDSNNILHRIISDTSRPKREKEKDGVDYNFLSYEDFSDKLNDGKMVEAVILNDWLYGTSYDSLSEDKINIGIFDPWRLNNLLDVEDVDIFCIHVKCSDKTRLIRQLNREKDPDVKEILRRFSTDDEDFQTLPTDITYYVISNEDGDMVSYSDLNLKINEWAKQ